MSHSDYDNLGLYFDRMGATPLLTKQDEAVLGKALLEGREAAKQLAEQPNDRHLQRLVREGQRARQKFIESNLRLVVHIVKSKYGWSKLDREDMVQIGNLGLIRAVDKFDYRLGYKFSTYAVNWIQQACGRAAGFATSNLTLTHSAVVESSTLVRSISDLENEMGREPTVEEIAERVGMDVERAHILLDAQHELVSLDSPVSWDDEIATLADLHADTKATDPLDAAAVTLLQEEVRETLGVLTDEERRIVEMRFGMNGYAELARQNHRKGSTSTEHRVIAQVVDKKLATVRGIERRALTKLRHELELTG